MPGGTFSNPELTRSKIRQPIGAVSSSETDSRIKRASLDRGIPNEKMHRFTFGEEVNFSPRGIGNVPAEKQFSPSSFYSKPSSLLTPYILLQPEINIGKTIWHISKIYRNLIGEPSKFTLCTVEFFKELIIRIRPDLETYIFRIIRSSEILYYKYFFLYILQCEQQELCWQITLQPSFLLGFNSFLYAVIKPELNYYPNNFRQRKIFQQ
jgi:hypothetical protein